MGKWSFQQELKQEKQKLDKSRREHLCKFYYDLAKLVFAGLVVGGGYPVIWKSLRSESLDNDHLGCTLHLFDSVFGK